MSNSIIKRNPRVTRTKSFKQEMADRKAAAMKRLKAFWEEYQKALTVLSVHRFPGTGLQTLVVPKREKSG